MSKLLGFIGLCLILLWFILLTAGVLSLFDDKPGSLFEVAFPWFRLLTYPLMFLFAGVCARYIFETPREPSDRG